MTPPLGAADDDRHNACRLTLTCSRDGQARATWHGMNSNVGLHATEAAW
jgi:hypothetical protein